MKLQDKIELNKTGKTDLSAIKSPMRRALKTQIASIKRNSSNDNVLGLRLSFYNDENDITPAGILDFVRPNHAAQVLLNAESSNFILNFDYCSVEVKGDTFEDDKIWLSFTPPIEES